MNVVRVGDASRLRWRVWRWLPIARAACLLIGLSLGGCATRPNVDATLAAAAAAGLATNTLSIEDFRLLVVRGKNSQAAGPDRVLHVYIAGDGTPWHGKRVAQNPGPFQPLAIELMRRDSAPSVLLGRPCYHEQTASCRASLWSFERYSQRVVDLMAMGLRQLSTEARGARLTLIGYSGGGVLAELLAREVAAVDGLVTLAAPLDVAAWTAHHSYTPLLGSRDPARLPPLRAGVWQLHLQGAKDQEVPPFLTQEYFAAAQPLQKSSPIAARLVLDAQTHRCCWLEHWPQLLLENLPN